MFRSLTGDEMPPIGQKRQNPKHKKLLWMEVFLFFCAIIVSLCATLLEINCFINLLTLFSVPVSHSLLSWVVTLCLLLQWHSQYLALSAGCGNEARCRWNCALRSKKCLFFPSLSLVSFLMVLNLCPTVGTKCLPVSDSKWGPLQVWDDWYGEILPLG